MDLTDYLVFDGGHSRIDPSIKADEETLALTLQRVQKLLTEKNEFLRKTLNENQQAINSYVTRVSQLQQGFEPLSKEVTNIKGFRISDPSAEIVAGYGEAIDAGSRFKSVVNSDDYCRGEMRNGLLEYVRNLGMLRDFEKDQGVLKLEKVKWKGKSLAFSLVISRKTKQLAKTLLASPKVTVELMIEAINLYIQVFYLSFEEQLSGLPHFSALFYNDVQFLLQMAIERLPGNQCTSILQQWGLTGSMVLQDQIRRQSKDITGILGNQFWTELDAEEMGGIQTSCNQVIMRLGQLAKVWSLILDAAVYNGAMEMFYEMLLEWMWSVMYSVEFMTPNTINFFKALSKQPLSLAPPSSIKNRIEGYLEAMDMGLMQLSNWTRRGHFEGRLTSRELAHLVEALFEDSVSRRACLEELCEDF